VLTWRGLLDVVLVVALLFQIYRLVRGTRSGQMLAGLLVLVGGLYLARFANLPALGGLLDWMSPYLGVAIVVLFQAEIRRGLAALGGAPLLRQWTWMGRGGPYEDVVLAAGRFSQERVGALMILERRTSLRTYIESGVPMDARLTYDLLVTIFQPGAPLHDGAAIIQRNRIAAAACFLPLSLSHDRPRELGSRHRAALGIAEDTDAVAVVVAEHTGVVSLAVDGNIEMGLTDELLRQRLRELFQRRRHAPVPLEPAVWKAEKKEGGASVVEMPPREGMGPS
jgi:diadenylate cyclase